MKTQVKLSKFLSIFVVFVVLSVYIISPRVGVHAEVIHWSMDTDLSNVDASFWGEDAGDDSGISVSGAGDVNNDGYDDFIVSAAGDEDGGANAGQTYLILGRATGSWSMDTDLSNADASFWGEEADDYSGKSVSGVGDVNNDGYDDFIIGAHGNSDGGNFAGQTYLILGRATGSWNMDMDLSNADASFWGEDVADYSGSSVSGVGDVNNDGYDDFIIGAYQDDDGGSNAGQTYLILGRATGSWNMDTDLSNVDASFWGEDDGDNSGRAVSGAGDVNNDGYDDFIIGAHVDEDGGNGAGQTYLILGRATASWSMDMDLSNASASFWGEDTYDMSGYSVSEAGDVNNDGYDDFIIGACGDDDGGDGAGQTYLILGRATASWSMDTDLSNADASFWGEDTYDGSGISISGAGDVNDDGYDDFIIGASEDEDGGSSAGQTYLIFGRATGSWNMDTDLSTADASFWGEDSNDQSGSSVSGAGDVNNDGYDDLIIDASGDDDGGGSAGQTYLILGGEDVYQIESLSGTLAVENSDGNDIEDGTDYGISGVDDAYLKDTSGNMISVVGVDLSADVNWSSVSGAVNITTGKSVVADLTSAPGTGSTHDLYIPIPDARKSAEVVICPSATSLGDVTTTCGGAITKTESDADASQVWIDNQKYWKVDGLTGTGGVSITNAFDLKDTLTRLQISVASDHTIEFGTVNGLLDIGDTIEVQFDPGGLNWNLTGVVLGDIDLEDDGTDLSLAAAADATHWGVSISTVTDTITFTHPTAADFEDIAADSKLVVKIGTVADSGSNQITNPGTAASYEITMKNTYSAGGGGTETGEVEIPIVDDDTVNITGYIDTVLSFDIDTVTSDTDCDASGGASPCDSHSSASDDSGYVVDLGEMTLSGVNKSGDSVLHADGLTGNINYLWFDLESNGNGGVVVTIMSQHESMYMDASNEIPDVATGSEQQITSAAGLYGINHRSGFINTAVSGSLVVHVDCDCTSGDDYYCDVSDGGTPIEVFNSNSNPVDDGRVQWAVGVAPDSSDGTGTYTDQLTFVATSTF